MKIFCRSLSLFLVVLVFTVVSLRAASIPPIDIVVKQKAGGKTVKQSKTESDGKFSITKLPPGSYTLEFRAKAPITSKKEFAIAIAGPKGSTQQITFPAAKLSAGVAVNMEIGPSARISGVVTTAEAAKSAAIALGPGRKMVDGVEYVWVNQEVGSNMPGRWVRAGTEGSMSTIHRGDQDTLRRMQDRTQGAAREP